MLKSFAKFGAILISTLLIVNLFGAVPTTLAQAPTPAPPSPPASSQFNVGTYLTVKGQTEISAKGGIAFFIVRVINFLALTIGSLSFVSIVIGGFLMVVSAGKEAALTKGKDVIKYALIGLVVALSAYFITAFVQSTFYELGTVTIKSQ